MLTGMRQAASGCRLLPRRPCCHNRGRLVGARDRDGSTSPAEPLAPDTASRTEAMGDMPSAAGGSDSHSGLPPAHSNVVAFRCVNCSRPGAVPPSTAGQPPSRPQTEWPISVHEVALPCTGRLQPEHLLKAFEAGADAVCVIACARDNCHYLEGSRRADRRVEHVKELLDELGLGSERLMVFHLPGSAREDMTLGLDPGDGSCPPQLNQEELRSGLAATYEKVMAKLDGLEPNPLRRGGATT